jgi:hypothetical protein
MRKRVPCAVDTAQVIDSRNAIDGVNVTELVEARMHADARVIDQRVDATKGPKRGVDEASALLRVANIGRHPDHLPTGGTTRLGRCFEQRWLARRQDKLRALGRKLSCNLEPDAG